MGKLDNIKAVVKDTRSRAILIITLIIIIIGVILGYWGLKREGAAIVGGARVGGAKPTITSVPGVGEPSREYVKTQQLENLLKAQEAAKKGGTAIPVVTRGGLIGVGEFRPTTAVEEECSPEALLAARAAGVKAEELRCKGCSAEQLRAARYSAGELVNAGFGGKDLTNAGFTSAELRDAGMTVEELYRAAISPQDLLAAGFTPAEVATTGLTAKQLAAAGVSQSGLAAAGLVASGQQMPKDCSVEELKKARERGISAGELKKMGCGAAALKAAGFTAKELKNAGFTAKELKNAGFSAKELKDAGFTAGELKAAGFSAKELKDAGFSAKELRDAGFSAKELAKAGFTADELRAAGFSDGDLIRAGFSPEEVYGAKTAVFSAAVFSAATPATAPSAAVSELTAVTIPALTTREQTDLEALEALHRRQLAQLSQQQREELLNQLQQAMASQAGELISSWTPPPSQQYVEGTPPKEAQAAAAGAGQGTQGQQQEQAPPVVKAGTIMFAVLDTGINSDEPSPIMATIVNGKFKGAKLLGSFQRVKKKVVLRFTTMSLPKYPNSITVNAVAIDPNKARTALATHVNSHYLLRYGTLFASSFIEGLGEVIGDQGTVTMFGPFEFAQVKPELSTTEQIMSALGEVGKKAGQELKPIVRTPPTVKVRAGYGIGILFMADVSLAEPGPTAGQLNQEQLKQAASKEQQQKSEQQTGRQTSQGITTQLNQLAQTYAAPIQKFEEFKQKQ